MSGWPYDARSHMTLGLPAEGPLLPPGLGRSDVQVLPASSDRFRWDEVEEGPNTVGAHVDLPPQ